MQGQDSHLPLKIYAATLIQRQFYKFQIGPFDTNMTMDKEPRQPQHSQQSLSQALSLSLSQLQEGLEQPDQPGSGRMPVLQPRARMSPDEERAYLLSTLEQALALVSSDDDDEDDA
jgi:hypothetical protein